MLKRRLISVLLLLDGKIVQSVRFKHTNIIHWDPATAVEAFDKWAVDEIVVLDVNRTPAKRETSYSAIQKLSEKCFVPLTVGGWIDSAEEMRAVLRMGADKVAVNTAAFHRPELITECAQSFGSQCVVASIDSKRDENGRHKVVVDRGREATDQDTIEWAKTVEERGAGEIFLNSVDNDGFRQGYDLALMREVCDAVTIPVIAMGGVLTWDHLVAGVQEAGADAVAAANIFHYTEHSTKHAKRAMRAAGIDVR